MSHIFSRVKVLAKTCRQHYKNQKRRSRRDDVDCSLDERQQEYLTTIWRDGFVVIPNFYEPQQCDAIRTEIDQLISSRSDQIVVDNAQADHRAFGANRISPMIDDFFQHPTLTEMMKSYQKANDFSGFTLAARIDFQKKNLGSGGGWHRDWPVDRQFKAIMYLSDVDQSHGPFQYWRGSHRTSHVLKTILRHGFEFNQPRFDDGSYEELFNRQRSMETLTGKKGTLILADTRGIHRGKPIQSGRRYALTNYYWPGKNTIPSHIKGLLLGDSSRPAAA